MAIIKQRDTRTGITYAYETTYVWDKEKKQSRKKSKIIGKIDPNTNEIVPTRGRKQPLETAQSRPPVKHQYYGATYLLDQLSETLGLTKDLKACFPMQYKQLLSIVYYMILEDNTPLYRFEKWHITHKHPYGEDITSPRSSDLFASISAIRFNTSLNYKGNAELTKNTGLMIAQASPVIQKPCIKFNTATTKKATH